MFRIKYLPQYFLALLIVLLILLEGWTYYLGRSNVTFERYVIDPVPACITDISVRRYKAEHSPHLFSITVNDSDEKTLIEKISQRCTMTKVNATVLPFELEKVDAEMVDVIKKSPYIYLTKAYEPEDPLKQRLCVLFRDSDTLYLFMHGDL